MNKYFFTGFLKRASEYGVDESTAIEMYEKYAGPVEDFKNIASPEIGVTMPGTLSTGTYKPTVKPGIANTAPSQKSINAGTLSAPSEPGFFEKYFGVKPAGIPGGIAGPAPQKKWLPAGTP